jgi:hypothetical protein
VWREKPRCACQPGITPARPGSWPSAALRASTIRSTRRPYVPLKARNAPRRWPGKNAFYGSNFQVQCPSRSRACPETTGDTRYRLKTTGITVRLYPLDRQDWRRSAMLGLFGRCAICGCKLKTGAILYRPLGDKDREAAQQFGGCVNQEGPTHVVCSLFSAMICPFFATPNARHSKGVARGRLAAVLGFRRIQVHRTSDGAEFVYSGLIDTIPFKDPSVLAGRPANEVSQSASIDVVDRMYWRSDDELAPAWEEAEKHLAGGSP